MLSLFFFVHYVYYTLVWTQALIEESSRDRRRHEVQQHKKQRNRPKATTYTDTNPRSRTGTQKSDARSNKIRQTTDTATTTITALKRPKEMKRSNVKEQCNKITRNNLRNTATATKLKQGLWTSIHCEG